VRQLPPEGSEINEEATRPSDVLTQQATITVAVSPQDAQKLTMAQELGRLNIVLRSLWEAEGAVELQPSTVPGVLGIPEQVRFRSRPAYRLIEGGQ